MKTCCAVQVGLSLHSFVFWVDNKWYRLALHVFSFRMATLGSQHIGGALSLCFGLGLGKMGLDFVPFPIKQLHQLPTK